MYINKTINQNKLDDLCIVIHTSTICSPLVETSFVSLVIWPEKYRYMYEILYPLDLDHLKKIIRLFIKGRCGLRGSAYVCIRKPLIVTSLLHCLQFYNELNMRYL